MDALKREYDRFGPWAIEISEEDPPPRLFEPHVTRPEEPLLAIKVPRHIERRNAHPGMDLYDYLVCLYQDDLLVLQRVGQEVRSQSCRYGDVKHLRVTRSLLRGNILLGLPGWSYDLPYNTVSDDLMRRVVAVIRQRYDAPPVGPAPGSESQVPEGVLSFLFEGLLATERRQQTGMRLRAAQGTVPVWSRDMSAVRRYLFRAAGKHLLESMHFSDGRELMILGRGQDYAYRWESIYGVDTWYIPLASIRAVAWRDDARNRASELTIQTDAGESVHVFAQGNPSTGAYGTYLSALPGVAKGRPA